MGSVGERFPVGATHTIYTDISCHNSQLRNYGWYDGEFYYCEMVNISHSLTRYIEFESYKYSCVM